MVFSSSGLSIPVESLIFPCERALSLFLPVPCFPCLFIFFFWGGGKRSLLCLFCLYCLLSCLFSLFSLSCLLCLLSFFMSLSSVFFAVHCVPTIADWCQSLSERCLIWHPGTLKLGLLNIATAAYSTQNNTDEFSNKASMQHPKIALIKFGNVVVWECDNVLLFIAPLMAKCHR